MIDKNDKLKVPKRLYIIDYQLKPCEIDGISDARLNAFPFNTTEGKLVEYLCLDTLWHPASEEPKSNTTMATCLVKHEDGMLKVRFYDTEYKRWIGEYLYDISCWLYIGDLLKGGGQ